MARTGRRPGESGTREAILQAARRSFAELGYDRATLRGVAQLAGVDPALVKYYFGDKQRLFVAAMDLPVNPAELAAALTGEPQQAGLRIVTAFLSVWDQPSNQTVLVGVVRAAVSEAQAARMLREFMTEEILGAVARTLGVPDARLRAALVASQLLGLAIARYIVRLEPLASLPSQTVAAMIGPTLQRYLTGPPADLGAPAGPRPPSPR